MAAYIYQITNNVNGKSYIGCTTQTVHARWNQHCAQARRSKTNRPILNALQKYGPNQMTVSILEETSPEEMFDRERHWIQVHRPEYNLTAGGEGLLDPRPETRRRMGQYLRTPEHRQRLREWRQGITGWTHSEETKRKIRAANAARVVDMIGRQFGQWMVIGPTDPTSSKHWQCLCACGRIYDVSGGNLRSGRSTRCKVCRSKMVRAAQMNAS